MHILLVCSINQIGFIGFMCTFQWMLLTYAYACSRWGTNRKGPWQGYVRGRLGLVAVQLKPLHLLYNYAI